MADVYATIAGADPALVGKIAEVLELRAADPRQQALRSAYLADLALPDGAHVLEIGCGTGPITRSIASLERVERTVGLDPSPILLEHARRLSHAHDGIAFHEGDARALPFSDREFDAVVFHTTLCHIPDPEQALAEAWRVLRPLGRLAIFDADYSTTSVANGPTDPLQACADACVSAIVHDPLIVHRLAALVRNAGFQVLHFRTHGYDGVLDPSYLLTIIDRGADSLEQNGRIGTDLARALRNEARRRADAGTFFGHLTYASLIGMRE